MRHSLFIKIFLGYFFTIAIFSFFILFFIPHIIDTYYGSLAVNNLEKTAHVLSPYIKDLLLKGERRELEERVRYISKTTNLDIAILSPSENLYMTSTENSLLKEKHKNAPEVKEALMGKIGKDIRLDKKSGKKYIYIALPIYFNKRILGIIRLVAPLGNVNNLFYTMKIKLMELVIVAMFLSLVVSFLFSRAISMPIKKLASASKKIAEGNFGIKLNIRTKDEIGQFARNFNYMMEKARQLFSELILRQKELDLVMSTIRESILVVDKNGKINLCNKSFEEMIGERVKNIVNNHYKDVIKDPDLIDTIEEVIIRKNYSLKKEISLRDKTFLFNATSLNIKGEIVMIFYDITEFKRLEKIKRDFVANVSHELRTPLTAIKGYVETLDEDLEGPEKKYLEIIKRNTERLINIVQDLLTLSKLEESETEFEVEEVELRELANGILKIFLEKAYSKGLELRLISNKNSIKIYADPFKIEQMFINLIDNAIKYTEKGKVVIYLFEEGEIVKIIVEDTGIGIPSKDLERVFERFYVVDKSRSRRLGGTGLGLSIVKHIVLLHNGKLNVESQPGEGTRFIIILPKIPS